MKLSNSLLFISGSLLLLVSCSVSTQISRQANKILFKDLVISTGHIGISIYEPATGTYSYNYDQQNILYLHLPQSYLT